jgi:glycerol-3-phosphate O-acyltransferase
VYVVPVTLTFQLVLEAETLIEDHLSEAGKQRYIIDDDAFSQPTEVASFTRRILELDSSVVVHYGQPLDCFGFPVSSDPAERSQQIRHRLGFVTDRNGQLQLDAQRDRMYTERLAASLVEEYPKGTTVMSTHLTAWAAWTLLCQKFGQKDPLILIRTAPGQRRLIRSKMLRQIEKGVERAKGLGLHDTLPGPAGAILDEALDRFGRFHKRRALHAQGSEICMEDPRLCLYYRNRLTSLDVEPES